MKVYYHTIPCRGGLSFFLLTLPYRTYLLTLFLAWPREKEGYILSGEEYLDGWLVGWLVGWMDGVFRFVCVYVRMYVCV
jgi:hypothetical protein